METAIKIAIYIHAFFGAIGLLSGSLSFIVKKGSKVHKKSGKWFTIGMLVSSALSVPIASMPGHENPFLVMIGLFTIYMVLVGNRALRFKKRKTVANKTDWGISGTMALISLLMLGSGIFGSGEIAVLFLFFGGIGLVLCLMDFNFLRNPHKSKSGWLVQHIGKIVGAYIASVTAFLVAGTHLSGLAVWILPAVVGNTAIIYWILKVKGVKLKLRLQKAS
ncbi:MULTISPECIES: hypothetical protein [unclassified Leeuwenhoekiella]|uniref:hypothetical protein n=1 Tax=unclassified Leeuwenhoekiella TaxID=2615029 RepID=UPI000C5F3607|nr:MULTISPECIES: hypothetical protein [unclassified Leeuwenhoekiella]MAW96745.1 hypothetical protein [Leeuwenhoekiella sp.]MBA81634.1 hypothetical protein [Leeuwenhoekiella sp.]|tara:strand:- start:10795 stop:11454 length:660 start_codon:yes stop_codon:yes gene_type:complete